MKLSVMCRILETVSLGLDIFGRVPDLTVIDAIAVGAFGANAVLMHSINSVEVSYFNSPRHVPRYSKHLQGGASERQDRVVVVGEERRRNADALLWPWDDGGGARRHLQVHSPSEVR